MGLNMNTKQANLKNNKNEILEAIKLLEPIAKTMSPKGANVMFRTDTGDIIITNDGATIVKHIKPKDELQRMIVDAIISASEHTNKEAGDATSTTVLLTTKILELFIDQSDTVSHFDFIKELNIVKDLYITELESMRIGGDGLVVTDDLKKVAYVSANNDHEIADLSVDVVTKAGTHGLISFDVKSQESGVKFEEGFIVPGAVPNPVFLNKGSYLDYEMMNVFITDDTLFFDTDINIIVGDAIKDGIKDILIVSSNFQAKTPDLIKGIHTNPENDINILPLQIESKDKIADLASYLGVKLHTRSYGKVKDETIGDFMGHTSKVSGTMDLVIIESNGDHDVKNGRIKMLESLEQTEDVKSRLASMTSGIVTLSVGGDTDLERMERKLRFEDSILATQKAMIYGYLPGAGSSMLRAYHSIGNGLMADEDDTRSYSIAQTIGTANAVQIQENSGIEWMSSVYDNGVYGALNALTGEVVDMKEEGIYDSYKAVEQSLLNAVSTSVQLISAMSNTIIIRDE